MATPPYGLGCTMRAFGDFFRVLKACKNSTLILLFSKAHPIPSHPIPDLLPSPLPALGAFPALLGAEEASKLMQPGCVGTGLSREQWQ